MALRLQTPELPNQVAIQHTTAAEWRRIREKKTERKGGESERGDWNNCVFIPPSDLLFCTVDEQESMEDEDAGSGSMSRTYSCRSVLKVMKDVQFVWNGYKKRMFMGALQKGL